MLPPLCTRAFLTYLHRNVRTNFLASTAGATAGNIFLSGYISSEWCNTEALKQHTKVVQY